MCPNLKKMKRPMAATLLPDDAVREILLRVSTVDAASLFRCAVTCKQWRALIADPSFLRLRWPEKACDPSSLLGFFDHRYHLDRCLALAVVSSPPSSLERLKAS